MIFETELMTTDGYIEYILHYEYDEKFEYVLNFELNKVVEWYGDKEVKKEELFLKGTFYYNGRIKISEHDLDFDSSEELDCYLLTLKKMQMYLRHNIKF
jgi:multimeric flavodoxin WrbA